MAEVLDKPNKTSNRSAERADKIMKTLPNVPDAGGDSEIDHQKSSSSQVDVFKSHEVDEDEGRNVRSFVQLLFKRKQRSYNLNS